MKINLSAIPNDFLSILPNHISVPLLVNQNLAPSLQAVQRYAFANFAFPKKIFVVFFILFIIFSWQPVGMFLSAYNDYGLSEYFMN